MKVFSPNFGRVEDQRFEAIVESYGGFLRSAIVRICPPELSSHVNDIEQEAKIRLWRALQSEKEIENVASYVYRIAATTTIDAIRRAKARREDQLRLAGEEEDVMPTRVPESSAPSPEAQAEHRELAGKIQDAMNRLADNRRRAVKLYLQGFPFQEVAKLLGWSDGKARNLIYRGLDDLRQELRRMGIERGTD